MPSIEAMRRRDPGEDGEKDGNLIWGGGIHLGKRVNSLSEYQVAGVPANRISTTRLNTNLEVEL